MDKKIHVAHIVFNNCLNDTRVFKESHSLKKNEYHVTIVGLHENGLALMEEYNGLEIDRIRLKSRSWSKKKVIQFIKYFEFIFRFIKKYGKYDIFHCNDLDTLPVGVIAKLFYNRKAHIIYDCHEFETELYNLKGIWKIISKVIERFFINYADSIITVSDSIAENYRKIYNIKKPYLVLNCPNYLNVRNNNLFRKKLNIEDEKKIFLYQGGLSPGRGIELILKTFKKLESSNKVVIFMGYGPLQKIIVDTSRQYENIYYHKAVDLDVLLNYTASADFGLLLYENNCLNHYYCMPNKMFEYIMAGLPVIVSDLYEMNKIVRKYKIGLILRNNLIDNLMRIIHQSDNLNIEELKNNLHSLSNQFNWENQEKVLLEAYNNLWIT